MSEWICPECRAGKHGNCDGSAWDDLRDAITECGCSHGTAEPGVDGGVMLTDEQLVREMMRAHNAAMSGHANRVGFTRDEVRANAMRAALEALTTASRLIPEGAEVREVLGTRHEYDGRIESSVLSEKAEREYAKHMTTVTDVDGHVEEFPRTLMSRTVITTPWREVQGGE